MNLAKYSKSLTALVTGVLGWCLLIADQKGGFGAVTAHEWVGLAIVVAVALGVYAAPANKGA